MKYYNTLKMLGVPSREALEFSDAHKMYHLSVNAVLKRKYRETILNTIILGKTLIEYHNEYVDSIIDKNFKVTHETTLEKRRVKHSDFNFSVDNANLDLTQINTVFDIPLQIYYKQEFQIN